MQLHITNKEKIQQQIDRVEEQLIEIVPKYQHIYAKDLIAYFDGPAPSGDTTTLADVMENRWLLIHELVELSELKNMGFEISVELLSTHPDEVDSAHVTAMEFELQLALEGNDIDWVKRRINGINLWLEEDTMPKKLKERCLTISQQYSNLELDK